MISDILKYKNVLLDLTFSVHNLPFKEKEKRTLQLKLTTFLIIPHNSYPV